MRNILRFIDPVPRACVVLALAAGCSSGGDDDDPSVAATTAAVAGPPIVTPTAIGTLTGTHAVTADGAATYSLPLEVPPGRAGMQPSLSIEYSSRRGGGPLGVGWALSGTSQIAPCGSIEGRDGELRPVQFTARDHACLDGARLVAIAAAEYRVEGDPGTRVTATGSDASGVTAWEVRAKDGRIIRYGTTASSRIESGPRRLAWLKSRVEDRSGNYMDFTYDVISAGNPPTELEWTLERIDYGGHLSGTPAPNRSVELEYASRPDPTEQYLRGIKLRSTRQLTAITMKAPSPAEQPLPFVRKYVLAYEVPPVSLTKRSRLASVSLCPPIGICMQPLKFHYSDASPAFPTLATYAATSFRDGSAFRMVLATDIDGDGRDDLVYRDTMGQPNPANDRISVRRGIGTALSAAQPSANPAAAVMRSLASLSAYDGQGAFYGSLGDGKVDLVGEYDDAQSGRRTAAVFPSNGPSFDAGEPVTNESKSGVRNQLVALADLDGDLRPDVLQIPEPSNVQSAPKGLMAGLLPLQDSEAWKGLNRCGGQATCSTAHPELAKVVDVDGDGAADVLLPYEAIRYPSNTGILRYDLLQVRGSAVEAFPTSFEAEFSYSQDYGFRVRDPNCSLFVDVNGDGLLDLVSVKGGITMRMNLGTGDFAPWQAAISGFDDLTCADGDEVNSNDPDPGVRVVDYNRDGRGDLLLLGAGVGATHRLLLSTGAGFVDSGIELPFGGTDPVWASRILDVNGDGLFDLVQLKPKAPNPPNPPQIDLELYVQSGSAHVDLLDRVDDGFGATVWSVGYKTLTELGYATPPSDTCGYSIRCVRAPDIVVASESLPDATSTVASPASGTAMYVARTHSYAGARADTTGWGFLGFATHTVTEPATGATERTTYDQTQSMVAGVRRFPFAGLPTETTRWVNTGSAVKATRTVTTYATHEATAGTAPVFFAFPAKTEVYEYEGASYNPDSPPATPLRKTTTTVTVDDYGNRLSEWVEVANVSLTGAVRNFAIDPAAWLVGRVNQEWFQSWVGSTYETRSNIYGYDAQGRLTAIQHDALLPASLQRRTCITRNGFGLPTRVDVTPGTSCTTTAETRTTLTGYDADGTFAVSTTNAAGHVSTRKVHPGFGVAYRETDANNLETTSQYDAFGRLVAVARPDGSSTTIARGAIAPFASCTTTSSSTGAVAIECADKLGQELRTITRSVDDREIYTDAEYDARGRLKAALRPRYATGAAYYAARYTYDPADRVTAVCQHTATLCKRTVYSGLSTDTYDEDNVRRTTRVDGAGQVVASTIYPSTTAPATTTYTYGPFGTLVKVTDAAGNAVTMQYDALGRQTRIDDKDIGWRATTYDAFGQVATLTDPKGQVTSSTYDRLGRLVSRAAPDGTDYRTYDTAPGAGKGRLAQQKRGTVTTTYTYDALGRPITERWLIDGTQLDYDLAYDALGRLDTLKYPVVPGRPRFTLKHGYGARGHLRQLQDASTATPKPLWTLTATTADEDPSSETLGNGYVTTHAYAAATGRLDRVTTPGIHDVSYVFSPGGNLSSRTDYRNGLTSAVRTESFTYDGANRLLAATVAGRTPATHSYGYDALGNVTSATDIQPACTGMVYGGAGKGPHQLASATCGGISSPHQYDANGNETSTVAPDKREQTWTSFDKVLELGSRHGRMRYTYDASHRRVKKERVAGALSSAPTPELPALNDNRSGVWDTTYYAGDRYEKRSLSGSTVIEHVFYVRAGDRVIAQLTQSTASTSDNWLYYHADYQGTPERFTDGTGVIAAAASYDAWGRRRHPDWTSTAAFSLPLQTRAGYTGHEHDDEVAGGVIDMGGRIYDAFFKRFTSADPLVQAPAYGPSWNRYSYVFNNPLRYTDPSGHYPIGSDATYYSFWGGMFAQTLNMFSDGAARFFLTGDGRARLSNPEPKFGEAPKMRPARRTTSIGAPRDQAFELHLSSEAELVRGGLPDLAGELAFLAEQDFWRTTMGTESYYPELACNGCMFSGPEKFDLPINGCGGRLCHERMVLSPSEATLGLKMQGGLLAAPIVGAALASIWELGVSATIAASNAGPAVAGAAAGVAGIVTRSAAWFMQAYQRYPVLVTAGINTVVSTGGTIVKNAINHAPLTKDLGGEIGKEAFKGVIAGYIIEAVKRGVRK